jgi:hypothetical protein
MAKRVDDDTYRVDAADPVSCFVTDRLGLDWPAVLFITFLVYGPIEKILLPWIGGDINLNFQVPMSTWIPDIEALLTGFVWFPFFFAYYIWSGRGLGRVFRRLARARVFSDEKQFQDFWHGARRSFNRRSWWIIAVVLAIGAMSCWQLFVWERVPDVAPWFDLKYEPPPKEVQAKAVEALKPGAPEPVLGSLKYQYGRHPLLRVLSILLIGIVAYALAQILIREILVLVWLTRLWRRLEESVVIHPYHHDDAGGMGGVGQHALQLSTFVVFLLLFIVMGSFLPGLRLHSGATSTSSIWDERLVIVWMLYFAFIASTIRPLLIRPHELMCRARDDRVSVVSAELDEQLERQQKAVSTKSDELEAIAKRIEELKKVRSQIVKDAPVWPFTTELRIKLGLSSMPALLLPVAQYGLKQGFNAVVRLFQ